MVTKIINHLVFEPAKVSIMANCGSGITIGSTHTTAPIGEGTLTVVVYTTLPNENILINFNYEDSSCSPTMTLTTAINPECIEVKIIEIECIEPEIPIISYDCDNGLVISNFDNNLTYNYLPGAFLTEGNYVLTVSNNGCIKEVPFTVQSCCFNYGVIANYSCSTKKLNITIYDTVTDSYIPGNPNWVVNADIADPAHCTSYVNPIPMTYFPSGSISMSSTGTLNLCNGSYSINIYLQVNNSCIIGTTVLVDCPCDGGVAVDYTCNSKELMVGTACISCNAYIKKLNANGFLFGDVPDDGTVLPLFPFYGKYPKNDYYYSIPSVNTLLAVNSFINSNDLGQLGSLSNGYYLVVLENGDCYTIYKFRVSCNEIECNLIHYDEGDVNDTDIRVIDVTGITGNVYIDLMTGGYPDSIELYYSNNNTATLSSLTSDTILVRTPPIVDYQCVTPPNQVINGFWQNNIGTGVAGNPYIWNGVNTSLYSISDNVPVDFTIPGSTWIATYPHAGGNPFDNYYSIPLSVYTANISNIDSGNYNGVYITSTNAYLSNDHMFISSSGRLNFNLDGSKNYIKLRLRYNENSCRQFFSDGITPWLSGFVYNFPYCCTIPNFRGGAGSCYANTDGGYVFATFNTAHTNMSIKFLVSTNLITNPGYVAQQYTGKYLGYGACPGNTCSSYIQLGAGTLNGSYMEYETVNNSVDVVSGDSVFALFNNSSGSILNLPNGEYKFIFIDGDCTAETSFTVNCGCITPEFKSPFVGFLDTDPSSAYFNFETLTTHSSGVITVGIKNPSAGYVTGQYDNQWLKLTPTTITDPSAYGTNIYYVQLLHESTPSIPGYDDTYKTAAVSLVSPVKIWGIYDNASNTFPPHNPIDVTNCEKLLFSITDGTCNGSSTVPITAVACESCESELTSFNVYPAISFYNDYLLGTVDHYFGNIPSSANGTVVDVTTDLNNGAYMWSLPDRVAQPAYLQAKDTANSDTLITNGLPDNQFIPISFTSNTMNNNNISLTPTNVSTLHDTWIYHNSTDSTQYNPILGFAMTSFACIPGSDNMRLDIELQVQIPATNVVINSTNITNNNIVGQLLFAGSYPGITTLTFGVMTSHGNNNVTVDLDLTNTTATSTVPAFTNLAQSFNLTFNLDCTDVL